MDNEPNKIPPSLYATEETVTPTQPSADTPSRRIHPLLIVSSVVFLLGLTIFSLVGLSGFEFSPMLKKIIYEELQSRQNIKLPTQTANTTSWHQYTNVTFGYKVKYPLDTTISSDSSIEEIPVENSAYVQIVSKNDFRALTIYAYEEKDAGQNLQEYVSKIIEENNSRNAIDNSNPRPIKIVSERNIDGKKTIITSNNIKSQSLRIDAYIEKSTQEVMRVNLGSVYEGSEDKYTAFFYDILSTIDFIDEQQI